MLHTHGVAGSSPVVPTNDKPRNGSGVYRFLSDPERAHETRNSYSGVNNRSIKKIWGDSRGVNHCDYSFV